MTNLDHLAPPPQFSPLLIDAGRSSWGWSGIGGFGKCARYGALTRLAEGLPLIQAGRWGKRADGTAAGDSPAPPMTALEKLQALASLPTHDSAASADKRRDARTWGSMGHSALAHFYTQKGLEQNNTLDGKVRVGTGAGVVDIVDPAAVLNPDAAVKAWCQKYSDGFGMISEVLAMMDAYERRHPRLVDSVYAVEWPVMAVVATHPTRGWHLWVLDQDTFEEPHPDEPHIAKIDGAVLEPTLLNMPGHPRHGLPLYLSRRIDLVSYDGMYWVDDHKCLARVEPILVRTAYAVDRGNVAFDIFGSQLWGDRFGGTRINFVSKRPRRGSSGYRFECKKVLRSRAQAWGMAGWLYDKYHERARYEVETLQGIRKVMPEKPGDYVWPDAGHDTGCCKHRYGNCDFLEEVDGMEVRACVG